MKIALFIIIGVVVLGVIAWVIGFMLYRARMQHYIFAHQILPGQLFADPVAMLAPMVSGEGSSEAGLAHLREIWEFAGEGQTGNDLVPSDGLSYSTEVLGHPNSTAFLVTLPPPTKKPEAYFALMVFDAPGLCCDKLRHLRYFVLEHHGESNGTAKTLVGEWKAKENGDLDYEDHGSDTPPDRDAFLAKVQEIIEASGSQPAPASES